MRLLEHDARKFLDSNYYTDNQKHKCIKNGFSFGILEFQDIDFWLEPDKDYTDKDFIRAVYDLNYEIQKMKDSELISNLARFLCGYDKQVECREEYLSLPENKRHSFFQNKKDDLDITNSEVENKIKFIKDVLQN